MPILKKYDPPAFQQEKDFAGDPAKKEQFEDLWNQNMDGWTQQARLGNPWNAVRSSPQHSYFDPLVTDIPAGSTIADVTWNAFPGRIEFYYPNFSELQAFEFADTGLINGQAVPEIPSFDEVCGFCEEPECPDPVKYGPYGPRGFQDEYCEWAVKRENDEPRGKITRVDFTCENPEYWNTLWAIDPETVRRLYSEIVGQEVTLDDITLKDPDTGNVVIDPTTGRPAYNPLNKWNTGTVMTDSAGGAVHLTATPNTVSAQIGLAAGASVLRTCSPDTDCTSLNGLLCCSDFGQPHRNSDPFIGGSANDLVEAGHQISLANPISLYGQLPDFNKLVLPAPTEENGLVEGTHNIEDCWQITRGETQLDGLPDFPANANFILHVRFEVPQWWRDDGVSIEAGDITVDGNPFLWGSQVAKTFDVGLFPVALPEPAPDERECLEYIDPDTGAIPQPLQCLEKTLWEAYNATPVENPMGVPMNVSSNTVLMPPRLDKGGTYNLVITCDTLKGDNEDLPEVAFMLHKDDFEDRSISVTVTGRSSINYAIPGFTSPSDHTLIDITVEVEATSRSGQRNIRIWNAGEGINSAVSGQYFLWIN